MVATIDCVDSEVDVLSWHDQVIIELLGWLEKFPSIGEDRYMFSGSRDAVDGSDKGYELRHQSSQALR